MYYHVPFSPELDAEPLAGDELEAPVQRQQPGLVQKTRVTEVQAARARGDRGSGGGGRG